MRGAHLVGFSPLDLRGLAICPLLLSHLSENFRTNECNPRTHACACSTVSSGTSRSFPPRRVRPAAGKQGLHAHSGSQSDTVRRDNVSCSFSGSQRAPGVLPSALVCKCLGTTERCKRVARERSMRSSCVTRPDCPRLRRLSLRRRMLRRRRSFFPLRATPLLRGSKAKGRAVLTRAEACRGPRNPRGSGASAAGRLPHESGQHAPTRSVAGRELRRDAGAGGGRRGREGCGQRAAPAPDAGPARAVSERGAGWAAVGSGPLAGLG